MVKKWTRRRATESEGFVAVRLRQRLMLEDYRVSGTSRYKYWGGVLFQYLGGR